jgi:hypothetical protein
LNLPKEKKKTLMLLSHTDNNAQEKTENTGFVGVLFYVFYENLAFVKCGQCAISKTCQLS